MIETNNSPSNIVVVNPIHIIRAQIYPSPKKDDNDIGIIIYMNDKEKLYLSFVGKKAVEKSLKEIYSSIIHNQPLFIIQYPKGHYGKVINNDEAVVGGVTLNTVQEALKNLKVNK